MAEPAKEALFVLIDVSESMRPHLGDAKDAMQMLINQKILFHKQDAVGVATMGSTETDNKVRRGNDACAGRYATPMRVPPPAWLELRPFRPQDGAYCLCTRSCTPRPARATST